MSFIAFLKEQYRQPEPNTVMLRELATARLEKLEAETAVEYAQSIVDYNTTRITRLEYYLSDIK
jgi:hypothetical protein